MTTEDDFQAMLDADPADHHTRAVFADWLDERGDPRGPGYRELARRQLRPYLHGSSGQERIDKTRWYYGKQWTSGALDIYVVSCIGEDWFAQASLVNDVGDLCNWLQFGSRRKADDVIALAWAALQAARDR